MGKKRSLSRLRTAALFTGVALSLTACAKSAQTIVDERENFRPPRDYRESFASLSGMTATAKAYFGDPDAKITPLGWTDVTGPGAPCGIAVTKDGTFSIQQMDEHFTAFPQGADAFWDLIKSCSPDHRPAAWRTTPPPALPNMAAAKAADMLWGAGEVNDATVLDVNGAPHEWDFATMSIVGLGLIGAFGVLIASLMQNPSDDLNKMVARHKIIAELLGVRPDYMFNRLNNDSYFGISFSSRRFVLGQPNGQMIGYNFADLTSAEVLLDTEAAKAGGARQVMAITAGALAAGLPGAIVGGAVTGQRTTIYVRKVLVRCIVNDPTQPIQDVVILAAGPGLQASHALIIDAERDAQTIHAHLLNAMRQGAG